MKTKNIIDGMQILLPYYDKPDGYHTAAEHDVVFMFQTDKPVSPVDIAKLVELGWFQYECNFKSAEDYQPSETWAAFV